MYELAEISNIKYIITKSKLHLFIFWMIKPQVVLWGSFWSTNYEPPLGNYEIKKGSYELKCELGEVGLEAVLRPKD